LFLDYRQGRSGLPSPKIPDPLHVHRVSEGGSAFFCKLAGAWVCVRS